MIFLRPRIDFIVVACLVALLGTGETVIESSANSGGAVFRDCDVCPEMVAVPAGRYVMGARASDGIAAANPQRDVLIERPFAVGRFEVTFDQWDACVRGRGCFHVPQDGGWGRGSRPVIYVSWDDAMQYVRWLSGKTGHEYRLLSEAEWEYAARAGTTTAYAFGEHIWPTQANYYTRGPATVGSYAPNAFGLHDMHGNVWEWTADCWHDDHSGAPSSAEARLSDVCSHRVLRGGSWDDYPWYLRSAERTSASASTRLNDIGFRVARAISRYSRYEPCPMR